MTPLPNALPNSERNIFTNFKMVVRAELSRVGKSSDREPKRERDLERLP